MLSNFETPKNNKNTPTHLIVPQQINNISKASQVNILNELLLSVAIHSLH